MSLSPGAETSTRRFRLVRMAGRDPEASHRAATPLELLFDLTFVVAFGLAADELAHAIADDHAVEGLIGFAFSMFAVCWAWINFSWFASAYDTDDWFYRVTTMVQMIGVIVLALGLPAVFASLEEGRVLDNTVVVIGYIIMRVAMIAQWLRVAREDPLRRRTALGFAGFIAVAQLGWIAMAVLQLPLGPTFAIALVLYAVEFAGPVLAERIDGGTPWHPHHIAERYGLLAIIALGEGVFGTVTSVSAVVEDQGWSGEAVLVIVAGIGLTFALWWSYFTMPSGAVLARHRGRAFVWGYAHILIFASIAAVGAGLHVAAYVIEGEAKVGVLGAIVSTAVPVLVFSVALFGIYTFLMRALDAFHIALFTGTVVLTLFAIALAASGASLGLCLVVLTLAPAVVVVGYETVGHRHLRARLDEILSRPVSG